MKINDIDLSKWRESEAWTHGLWVGDYGIPKIKDCGSRKFHGNYVPHIPYQMMLRYSKVDDNVLDVFAGSGTTDDVAKILGRNCDMFDISPVRDDVRKSDAETVFLDKEYQIIFLHPPYANIIKFSDDKEDLSNLKLEEFYSKFRRIVKNILPSLTTNGVVVLVCGEIYQNGEEIPLGFYLGEIIREFGLKRKAVIVKDYGETCGGAVYSPKNRNLQRYRHLKYGTWEFFGDMIQVFFNSPPNLLKSEEVK